MPGILLDHVNEHIADARRIDLRSADLAVESVYPAHPLVSVRDLCPPVFERLLDHGRLGHRSIEVQVVVVWRPEQPWQVAMALQRPLKPAVLHPGHMPNQTEQAQRGRWHGPSCELFG